jgi:formate dehydrogenase major subunit
MDLVKLEIDGRRVIADNRQTILEVARENGIGNIPTLCHDGQLEPFASCFVCVVKVAGARTLLPACSTRVAGGMVVETNTPEVRRSRKAALELMLSNHFADCVGPCQLACPAGVDIQGYVALAALGKYRDAIQLIKDRNPLPAVCGRVCTRPCEVTGCRRNLMDEAVGIDYIKRYLADLDLGGADPWRPRTAPANGHKVAIVGAGPAGLSCAYYLALHGYEVALYESLPEAGGMLRYGIPEYRLPKEILDLEINQILDLGPRLHTNVALGKEFTISSLKEQGFEAVFVGIGAWESSKMRVQDEDTEGVLPGIDFLKEFGLRRAKALRGRVLVVGGGNTAIDCARTSLRLGADEVRLLYRRTRKEMPANSMEIDEAEHEGVGMDFLVAPVRVIKKDGRAVALECLRMELGEPDSSGRRSPKPVRGSEFVIECDTIIAAIGQNTQVPGLVDGKISNFLPFGEVLNLTRWQTIQTNPRTFETSVEGVFSGGDVVTGAATAIEAIAAGRKAAYAIHTYVSEGKARPEPVEFFSKKDVFRAVTAEDLNDGSRYPRRAMPVLPPDERVKSFAEVEQGYSTADLKLEAARCLECGCVALFDCDLRRYGTEYQVDLSSFLGEAKQYRVDRRHPLIHLDPNKCILCGRCVRICSEVVGVAAYGFINRGFGTVVKPAMGDGLLETDCVSCGLCLATCPTGAIEEKIPLAKPGPWPTASIPSVCAYCGVGCRVNYETFGDSLVRVSRREDGGPTAGNHCRRGRFGYNYIQSSDRLRSAWIRSGRELQEATVDEAISYTAMRLKELRRKYSGDEIAVFVSPRMTNEEIYLGQKFARIALGTHQVSTLAHTVNRDLFCPDVVTSGGYRDLEDAQAVVVVNSELDEEHFTVDLMVKKAVRKGARLIYIGPRENRVSAYADVFIRCRDGGQAGALLAMAQELARVKPDALSQHAALKEALARLGPELTRLQGENSESVRQAVEILGKSIIKILVYNRDYRGPRIPHDERLFEDVAAALDCSTLGLREKSNMQGLLDLGANPGWLPGYFSTQDAEAIARLEREWCVALRGLGGTGSDPIARLREKKIKVAVVLGEDPVGAKDFPRDICEGLCAADFLVVGDLFLSETGRLANVVLPLSSTAETNGTFTNQERRIQVLQRAIPPLAGVETWELLCHVAGQMGYRFKMRYAGIHEVWEEIRRVVPIYAHVVTDSGEGDGIWGTGGFGLAPVPFDYSGLGRLDAATALIQPVPTLALDSVESRFVTWFGEIFEAGRRAADEQAARV